MASAARMPDRPLALRKREDLIVVEQQFRGERYWVVKDPLSLRFARLREFEYAIWHALDGRTGLRQLVELFEARFAPQRIKVHEVSRFVTSLHQLDLLISESPGQGEMLVARRSERGWKTLWSKLANPLSIKFSVCDPTRAFDLLLPAVSWIFSPLAVLSALVLFVVAGAAIALRWSAFAAQVPTAEQFLTPDNLLLVGCVLAAIKVLHEFGHGLACRAFGGECRDLGVMLLVFTPCLYCDVSDAWRFPDRARRILVAAAGMYFEFLLAAVASLVWATAEPGLLSRVCLTVVVVSSVSTLLFNANPLMRYDGYYILSDALEVPNLAQRSASALRQQFLRLIFGDDAPRDPLAPHGRQRWYIAYAVASALYRWGLTLAIVVMLVAAARPYRLENLSRLAGVIMLASIVAAPIVSLRRMLPKSRTTERMKPRRIGIAVGVLLLIVGFIAFVPVPHGIDAPCELQLRDAEQIYVEVPGRIVEVPQPYGAQVDVGTPLVRLTNREVDLEIERLEAKLVRLDIDIRSIKAEAFSNPAAAGSLAQSEKLLTSLQQQLDQKRADQKRLTPLATRSGTLYPPPTVPDAPHSSSTSNDADLTTWTGRPLDPENVGATLEIGTPLGAIGDPTSWQAMIVVDQEDVEFVRAKKPGDPITVEILLDALPEKPLSGTVAEIAIGALRDSPRRLSNKAGGEVATKTEAGGGETPVSTSYLVRVHLTDPDGLFVQGWRGTAKIHAPSTPLGKRLWRSLSRTFHFEL
jgi:putative peptide zinc metalloprotease protein